MVGINVHVTNHFPDLMHHKRLATALYRDELHLPPILVLVDKWLVAAEGDNVASALTISEFPK